MGDKLPYFLFAGAALAAVAFSITEDAVLNHALASLFALLLGLALCLWGMGDVRRGKVRGKRRYVRRDEWPILFWSLVLGSRLLPGAAMVFAGLWYLASQSPS